MCAEFVTGKTLKNERMMTLSYIILIENKNNKIKNLIKIICRYWSFHLMDEKVDR